MRHGNMNLMQLDFLQQFGKLMRLIGADNDVKVVVIESALADYFMAHSVSTSWLARSSPERGRQRPIRCIRCSRPSRGSPKVFIAQIEGRARGGGSEFAMGMDMSFAARGRALLS